MTARESHGVPTVTLQLPASTAHVRTARLVAAAMARRSGVDAGALDEIRLAVGEACARAMRLHARHGLTEPVTVEFVDGERFRVSVLDRALAEMVDAGELDGDDASPEPSFEALGLALLAAVVPELVVSSADDGSGGQVVMSWPVET